MRPPVIPQRGRPTKGTPLSSPETNSAKSALILGDKTHDAPLLSDLDHI
jgi:hypothetical protein